MFVIKSNLHSLPSFSFGGKNTDLRSWCTRIFIGNLMNKNLKTKKIVMTSKRSFHANDTRTCSVCRPPNSLKLDSLKLHNPEPQDYLILQNELCVVLIFRCYTIWAPGCNTSQRNTKKKRGSLIKSNHDNPKSQQINKQFWQIENQNWKARTSASFSSQGRLWTKVSPRLIFVQSASLRRRKEEKNKT